jgi:hypothetical protein
VVRRGWRGRRIGLRAGLGAGMGSGASAIGAVDFDA